VPVAIIVIIAMLWFGAVTKHIARTYGENYVKEHFPKMQLKCVGVEWSNAHGDYLIAFKDSNGKTYSCVIYPAHFPTTLGQGLFGIEEDYAENFK